MIERIQQQDVERMITVSECLTEIRLLEREAFLRIVRRALAHPYGVERWPLYILLKEEAEKIVGFAASHAELCTTKHYESLISLIDRLLPQSSEEDCWDEHSRGQLALEREAHAARSLEGQTWWQIGSEDSSNTGDRQAS